jgi:hypothetical protein
VFLHGASSAAAKTGRLQADEADLPAIVKGTVRAGDFRKSIRLHAVGGAVSDPQYLVSDLVGVEDATRTIDRSEVKVDGLKAFALGDYLDAIIVVSNVKQRGSYVGTLELFARGNRKKALILPLTVVASPRVPFANTPEDRIEIDSEDTPLEIDARLGEETSFSDSILLHSTGDKIEGVTLIASRLKTDDAEVTLPPTSVKLSGVDAIPADTYVTATIKVEGVTKPGLYLGSFTLLPQGQTPANGTFVLLTVNVKGTPHLDPIQGSASELAMKITRCHMCGAAKLIVSNAGDDEATLRFQQPDRVNVILGTPELFVEGEKRNVHVTDAIRITTQKSPSGVVEVVADVTALKLPADKYSGTLRIPIKDAATPLNIPVTITVKDGVLGALLALLLGLLIARLLQAQGRWGERMKALDAIAAARARAESEVPNDAYRVEAKFAQLDAAARRGDVAVVPDAIKAINARIDVLAETRKIQQAFPDLASSLEQVRDLVEGEQDDAAKSALAKIKTEIANRQPGPRKESAIVATAVAIQQSQTAQQHVQRYASRWTDRYRVAFRSTIYFLAGIEDWTAARADRDLYIIGRIAVGLITFAIVAFVALKALYINGSDTFGVDGFYDYAAVVIGGSTAAVTQRVTANASTAGAS